MPSFFNDLVNNHVLVNTSIAWLIAQSIKILLLYLKKKTLNLSLLMSPGGMPSTHSTIVVTVAATIGRDLGWHSPFFGMAAAFAFIVMYDAAGIRRAAGKQAEIVNQLVDDMYQSGEISRERLKELLGHKPIEVFAGALLGIALALLF